VSYVLAVFTIAVLAFMVGGFLARPRQPQYRQISFRKGYIPEARFTPDGQTLIYGAAWGHSPIKLYSSRVDGTDSRSLDMPPGGLLAVSRLGELAIALGPKSIYFLGQGASRLARAPLAGGAPRELLDQVGAADWSPDSTQLAVAHFESGKCRLEYPIGKLLYETIGWISHIRLSPQGDAIAFMDHQLVRDDRGTVAIVDLNGNKRTLTAEWEGEQGLAWSPDGSEVWFSAAGNGAYRDLYAVNRSGKQRLVLRIPAMWS
jgi:Tol biopolymer transport system component